MKPQYSISLILIWKVADVEARHLNAANIVPMHLLLALSKVVDLDLPELVSKDSPDRDEILEEYLREVRKIRTVFRAARVDPKVLRRRLRGVADKDRITMAAEGRLRRSAAAREVFAEAEQFAQVGDGIVFPIHLLYATLMAGDADRDGLFKELKIDKKRLLESVKGEVLSRAGKPSAMKSNSRTKWN
jgi:hypothetical protein